MWWNKQDHFSVLGIDRDSNSENIKQAYYRLAKSVHPDHNRDPNAEIRFKSINEAYEVLKNEERRAKYLLELGISGEDRKYHGDSSRRSNHSRRSYQRLYLFERIVHPRNLFVLFPMGILSYFGIKTLIIHNRDSKAHSNDNDHVDAWLNPRFGYSQSYIHIYMYD